MRRSSAGAEKRGRGQVQPHLGVLWLAVLLAGCSGEAPTQECSASCAGATDCYAVCVCEGNDAARCLDRCPDSSAIEAPPTWSETWQRAADAVLYDINMARRLGGCCEPDTCFAPSGPLSALEPLTLAARTHAADMLARDYFSHDSPEGLSPFDRLRALGFHGCAMAENLAQGQPTAQEAVEAWLASPEHCVNLLDPRFSRTGIAYAESDASTQSPVWVQELGD